jgi:hypothetical protein
VRKQWQLAHGVWNRAGQLIVVQISAKLPKMNSNLCSESKEHITHRRLCSNSQVRK